MAGMMLGKMKRKDLDEIYDEFSDFSLVSPARKIRRLDAELPPIMEDGPEFPAYIEQPLPEERFEDISNNTEQLTAAITEPIPSVPLNEERALVLYKPVNTFPPGQLFQSPGSSEISLRVNSDLLPGFKNQVIWSRGSHNFVKSDETTASMDVKPALDNCLAVIPWVANQFSVMNPAVDEGDISPAIEPMDAEEAEAMMDEDTCVGEAGAESGGIGSVDGLHQRQQHCMAPQPPQPPQPATPIMW